MKKPGDRFKRTMALVLAAALLLTTLAMTVASVMTAAGAESAPDAIRYEVSMTIDEELLGARVAERLFFRNDTGKSLTQLLFDLPVNAYRRRGTLPFETDELAAAYPSGFSPAGASIASVTVNGNDASWGAQGEAETALRVSCDIAPGETCEVAFAIEAALPECAGLIGAGDMGLRLYGLFPVLARYDAALDEFVLNEYSALDTSLFCDAARFDITVTAPCAWELCAGGDVSVTREGDARVWHVSINDCRYPLIALSARYRLYDGNRATVYANSRTFAREALEVSERVMETYEAWFGEYPYGKLRVAQADVLRGAARAGVLLTDGGDTEYLIAYLAAKQWFGEGAGVNGATEAWLTDAVSAYAALMYYETRYGHERFLKELNERVAPSLRVTIPGGLYPDSETNLFGTRSDFDAVVVKRGAACMHEVRGLLGEEAFKKGLGLLARRGAGKVISIADFAACMNEASGRETDYFLMEMFRDIDSYVEQGLEWYE